MAYFSLCKDSERVSVTELKKASGGTSTQIKALIDKSIFEEHFIEVDRLKLEVLSTEKKINLSNDQLSALSSINSVLKDKDVCLFHGVTSSGKTEIYVKMIEAVLAKDQQALFLVPEIALTSQLVLRLKHYFGDQIAVYHSRFSPNERVEIWNKVLQNSEEFRTTLSSLATSYVRAYLGDFIAHKKIVKYAYPVWLYVAITGVIVYLMISPYYV